jgi:hypothetical protein
MFYVMIYEFLLETYKLFAEETRSQLTALENNFSA